MLLTHEGTQTAEHRERKNGIRKKGAVRQSFTQTSLAEICFILQLKGICICSSPNLIEITVQRTKIGKYCRTITENMKKNWQKWALK